MHHWEIMKMSGNWRSQSKIEMVSVDSIKSLHFIFDTSNIHIKSRESAKIKYHNGQSYWFFILLMRDHDTEWESKNIQEFLTQSIIDTSVIREKWLIANDP